MSDLVDRLKKAAHESTLGRHHLAIQTLYWKAAERIEEYETENKNLKEEMDKIEGTYIYGWAQAQLQIMDDEKEMDMTPNHIEEELMVTHDGAEIVKRPKLHIGCAEDCTCGDQR